VLGVAIPFAGSLSLAVMVLSGLNLLCVPLVLLALPETREPAR
jgi:hypothetical protein